ncbi:MAG: hypothetical protein ACQEQO_09170 [Thermodesulfobacteriota bacterium]
MDTLLKNQPGSLGLRPDSVLEGTPSRKGGPTPRRELKKCLPSLGKYELC